MLRLLAKVGERFRKMPPAMRAQKEQAERLREILGAARLGGDANHHRCICFVRVLVDDQRRLAKSSLRFGWSRPGTRAGLSTPDRSEYCSSGVGGSAGQCTFPSSGCMPGHGNSGNHIMDLTSTEPSR